MKSILKNISDADSVKRKLSSAGDLVRRLDESLHRAKTVSELFSAGSNVVRLRLRDLCEQMLLSDVEEAGRRAEDLLWRKVHYEPYSLAKQIGQASPLGAFETSLLANHLLAGIGSYQQLILSLQAQHAVGGADQADLSHFQPAGFTQETVTVRGGLSPPPSGWGTAILQRFLTNLGDLARYLSDLQPVQHPHSLAARYYNQAVLLSPSVGRPHNQLGTLAGGARHGLLAAYHYLRCMTCHDTFDGGVVNLRKLLEKNHTRRVELEIEFGNSEVPARRRLIISFLDVIYGATLLENAKQHRFVRLCQETLQWLSFCLQPAPLSGGPRLPVSDALQPRTVLLMVVVVILALQTLKEDAAPASGLRALLLAMFSCLVGRVWARVSCKFPGLTAPPEPRPEPTSTQEPATPRRRGRRPRRRAPRDGDDDSDDEDDDPAPMGSDSDSDSEPESVVLADSEEDSEPEESVQPDTDRPDSAQLVLTLRDEGLLVPLRLCCDWLRANEEVLKSCTESSANLWRQLVALVNAITVHLQPDDTVSGVRTELVQQQLAATTPLWEDRLLRGVDLLGTRHQHMDWTSQHTQSLTEAEQAVLRVHLLVDFTAWLSTIPQLGVSQTDGKFYHLARPTTHRSPHSHNETTQENNEESGQRRRQLMTSMAEQWLRAEVRSLRCRTGRARGGQASFSPYVVVDTAALVAHLVQLKQMTKARQFITVVPATVIHELDERKAACPGAREASRWLETQFRRGNRFLRPQRANEKASLQMVKYPRRKQRDQWHFFQILECCSHLAKSIPSSDASSRSVTLLVGGEEAAAPGREFSPRGLAAAAGIHFELITTFHSKWAISSKGRS